MAPSKAITALNLEFSSVGRGGDHRRGMKQVFDKCSTNNFLKAPSTFLKMKNYKKDRTEIEHEQAEMKEGAMNEKLQ